MVGLDLNDCDAEIIKDHNALTYTLKPRDLEEAADMACKLKVSDMNTVFPDVGPIVLPCLPVIISSVLPTMARVINMPYGSLLYG